MEGTVSGLAVMPFAETLGIELVSAAPGEVRARLAWHERFCTAGGILHGGALMALADSTGALCASLNLTGDTTTTTTIESKTNFLASVTAGHVSAVARPLHVGRTIVVVDTELRDDSGRLLGRTTQSQLVVRARTASSQAVHRLA